MQRAQSDGIAQGTERARKEYERILTQKDRELEAAARELRELEAAARELRELKLRYGLL